MGSVPNLSSSSAAQGGTVGPASYGAVTIGGPGGGGMLPLIIAGLAALVAVFALVHKKSS